MYTTKPWYEHYTPEDECHSETDTVSQDDISICGPGGSHCGTTEYVETYSHTDHSKTDSWHDCQHQHPLIYDEDVVKKYAVKETVAEEQRAPVVEEQRAPEAEEQRAPVAEEQRAPVEEVRPRHPYDNFYLLHRTVMDQRGKRCSHEAPPTPSPPPTPPPPPCLPSPPPSPPPVPQDDQVGPLRCTSDHHKPICICGPDQNLLVRNRSAKWIHHLLTLEISTRALKHAKPRYLGPQQMQLNFVCGTQGHLGANGLAHFIYIGKHFPV